MNTEPSITLKFAELKRAADEAQIRLYGVLWFLVQHEIISEARARELGNMPLHKMIDQCVKYLERTEDRELEKST